ncbi:hypothetical protein CGMCC3_g14840 [Colletotrichum fructicola]|nr:uncharacterized protein CGMCC3_g14840 [Colletotrichum fructicola]KAE9569088.1 hypothetical protein CGMCC3_g14840 [Colletotrichum fructicola]
MLSQATTPQKVWSIDLGCDNLQAGDSGSWVVHKHDNVLLGVLIARSSNSGFLAPFTEVQKEIGAILSLPPSGIGLPSHQLDENFPGISVQSIEEAEEDLEGPAVMNPAESNAVDSSKKAGKTTGATYDIIVSGVVEVLAVASVTILFLRRAWLSGPQSTLRLLVTIAEIIFVFGCLIPVIKEGPTWMYIRHAGWGVLWRVTLTNECAEEWVCFDCRKIHWDNKVSPKAAKNCIRIPVCCFNLNGYHDCDICIRFSREKESTGELPTQSLCVLLATAWST